MKNLENLRSPSLFSDASDSGSSDAATALVLAVPALTELAAKGFFVGAGVTEAALAGEILMVAAAVCGCAVEIPNRLVQVPKSVQSPAGPEIACEMSGTKEEIETYRQERLLKQDPCTLM